MGAEQDQEGQGVKDRREFGTGIYKYIEQRFRYFATSLPFYLRMPRIDKNHPSGLRSHVLLSVRRLYHRYVWHKAGKGGYVRVRISPVEQCQHGRILVYV